MRNSSAQFQACLTSLEEPVWLLTHVRLASRHQRLYSLLDRLRLATAPGSRGPTPLVTSHPLDGDGPLALEAVNPDKVSVCV